MSWNSTSIVIGCILVLLTSYICYLVKKNACSIYGNSVELVRRLEELHHKMASANTNVLTAFASSLEKRDAYTAGHSERVAMYALQIAAEMGLPRHVQQLIHLGGLLHDIGKIGIPDRVLNKQGPLDEEEYAIMKQHPVIGEELLRKVYQQNTLMAEEEKKFIIDIVLYHHERPDGRGYPQNLTNDRIPYAAKIMAVADAYDAMTSYRSYRQAMTKERAIEILSMESGSQFWTPAVDAFLRILREEKREREVG